MSHNIPSQKYIYPRKALSEEGVHGADEVGAGPNVIKLFCPYFTNICNKLISSQAFPAYSIKLGLKSWPGTNILAYYENE